VAESAPAAQAFRNAILGRLPQQELEEILPDLQRVSLPTRHALQEAGEPIEALFFMESGVCSVVLSLASGVDVEVGMIGREGVVNAQALELTVPPITRAFAQVEGHCYRINLNRLRNNPSALPALRAECARYLNYLYAVAAQSAACNRQHDVAERLARWLLQVSEQSQSDSFTLTQEFIAEMLGVRRPTVSVSAMSLQTEGLITYRRGHIRIIDREGLEAAACECYQALHEQMRLLETAPASQ
jgi:CRP-like cAMP-binding protein